MENSWLEIAWQQIGMYVHVPYLLTFMLLAYLIKEYCSNLLAKIFKREIKTVFIVFIIATILAVLFLVFEGVEWQKILFSYTLGTSLHELIFKWLEKKIKGE